jgi:hypothetical protein
MTALHKSAKGVAGAFRLVTAWIVAATLLLSTITVQGAVAQDTGLVDDTTYVLVSGQTVTWTEDWEIDPELSGPDQGIESVFLNADLSFVFIMTLPPGLDIETARDDFLEGFSGEFDSASTIDRGAYDDLSYSLDMVTADGAELGTFLLFRSGTGDTPSFGTFFAAPVPVFADQFSNAQQTIQVNGEGIFSGVGGVGLQDLLEASSGTEGGNTPDDGSADDGTGDDGAATPEGSGDQTDDPAETPESGGDTGNGGDDKLGGGDESADDGTGDDGSGDDQGEDTQDTPSGETGLIDDNTFVSPLYGVETTWDATYALDTEAQSPVVENGEGGVDAVSLAWTGDGPAFLTITFIAAGEATDVTPIMDLWTSEDFVSNAISSPDGGIVMADSSTTAGAVIYLDFTSDDVPVIYYREVHYLESQNAFAMVTFFTVPQLIEGAVGDAQNGVTINGEPALAFYSVAELLDEFGG